MVRSVAVLQFVQRLGDMRAVLMGVTLDHDHRFVAANTLHGGQVYSSLHKVRDGCVTQRMRCYLIRVAAASSYADPSLNRAIKDDELSLSVFALKGEISAWVVDRKTGKPGRSIQPIGDVTITNSVLDFYAYCMCDNYDYRLLDDFEASAMVVVHDHQTFVRKFLTVIKEQFGDDYSYLWVPVYYADPYNYDSDSLSTYFAKHFRYAYQHEYRFLMVPKTDRTELLPPFFINLGSLEDVATYYCLERQR